jgi:tetratricopeptide (TPR) repeat protein
MIASEHYDEETLIEFAEDRAEKDTYPHLSECTECHSAVEQYRTMITCMSEDVTWDSHPIDETPNPETIATLRSFVDRMQQEDAEAEPLVAELLAGSREEWMPRLMADPKYRTAGVVRKLIAAMPAAVRATPRDAELMALIATLLADDLSDSNYRPDEIGLLRGSAWRERAFASFYVGEHANASRAAEIAFRALVVCSAADHELARLKVLNAVLCREDDQVAKGIQQLKEAETYFLASDQLDRVVSTLITRTALLAKIGDFAGATEISEKLVSDYASILSDVQRAMLHGNLGYYHSERGNFVAAMKEFDVAAFMFDSLDMKSDAIQNRWNVAVVFERAGMVEEALQRLLEVAAEFESLGMNGMATRAALGAAQIHVAREEYEAVEAICERALDQFRRTGLANSSSAMTAIALLREASRRRHVPGTLISDVATSMRDLPDSGRTPLVMQLSNDRT